jgi:REP element-mobilizing transposase RayT
LHAAFSDARVRGSFRLVHFSAQSNHLHLLVEAGDRAALGRGMQGLAIRLARRLNRLWGRRGGVFADRYHARALRTPREVRHALVYVLANARRHGIGYRGIDPHASGAWFGGWRDAPRRAEAPCEAPGPVSAARTWLLAVGWRRHGLIGTRESPRAG